MKPCQPTLRGSSDRVILSWDCTSVPKAYWEVGREEFSLRRITPAWLVWHWPPRNCPPWRPRPGGGSFRWWWWRRWTRSWRSPSSWVCCWRCTTWSWRWVGSGAPPWWAGALWGCAAARWCESRAAAANTGGTGGATSRGKGIRARTDVLYTN